MRRAIIAAAIGALLLGACGDDDTDTASAGTSTTRPRATTTETTVAASDGPTSDVACGELYDLFQAGSAGEVYDIEWPGRLEEVQRVAEVDGDAWLYAELETVIDEFNIRNAEPGVEAAGRVLDGCFSLIADDIAADQ